MENKRSSTKKCRAKQNQERERIIENNLIKYLDVLPDKKFSARNKEIIRSYVGGLTKKALAKEYGITENGISSIIHNYIRYSSSLAHIENLSDEVFRPLKKDITMDYICGMSKTAVAKKYEVSYGVVADILYEFTVKTGRFSR